MKKLLLTAAAALTILFAQAQCQADFSYMQNGPTTVFTDLSTVNSSWSTNYSVTWVWDFGDGNTSTLQNPTHTYSNGIYAPCLTVTYFDSTLINYCISIYCDSIFVGNGPSASWDCGPAGCFDPGTGLGQYSTISSCQSVCSTGSGVLCDSMTAIGSQSQITMQVNNINTIIDYWITTAPDGTVLGEDSMWNMHNVYNFGTPAYDTLTTCITYGMGTTTTCCVEWIWDANSGLWAKMGSVTSIGEIGSFDKKLIKVVDILGRETSINSNQTLFFIYEDGTIEKRYIIDRK